MKPHEVARELRLERGLSQTEVADKLHVSASLLNLIEHGKRPFKSTLIEQYAEILGVAPGRFFEQEINSL